MDFWAIRKYRQPNIKGYTITWLPDCVSRESLEQQRLLSNYTTTQTYLPMVWTLVGWYASDRKIVCLQLHNATRTLNVKKKNGAVTSHLYRKYDKVF